MPLLVLRIGDVCIGTGPCETFAEIGLEFKRRSPLPHSFMVYLADGYIGYLPTRRHFELATPQKGLHGALDDRAPVAVQVTRSI